MTLQNGLVDWEVFRAHYMADQDANRRRRAGRRRFSDSLAGDMAVLAGTHALLDCA